MKTITEWCRVFKDINIDARIIDEMIDASYDIIQGIDSTSDIEIWWVVTTDTIETHMKVVGVEDQYYINYSTYVPTRRNKWFRTRKKITCNAHRFMRILLWIHT